MRFSLMFPAVLATTLCCTACNPATSSGTPVETVKNNTDLADFFDCLRENGKVVISAHRGGPAKGYAENTLSTFRHTIENGFTLLEMDIRRSADGKLFVYHDDELGRVGVGSGKVNDMSWSQLKQVVLKDDSGATTDGHIPLFANVLRWARNKNVILQVDFKRGLAYQSVIQMIRKNGMSQRVVLISYTAGQAKRLRDLAPEMMISAGGQKGGPISQIRKDKSQAGSARYLLAWMGMNSVKPARMSQLRRMGIEPIQGTMGHIDRYFAYKPQGRGYQILDHEGVVVFATNKTEYVRTILKNDDDALSVCALPSTS